MAARHSAAATVVAAVAAVATAAASSLLLLLMLLLFLLLLLLHLLLQLLPLLMLLLLLLQLPASLGCFFFGYTYTYVSDKSCSEFRIGSLEPPQCFVLAATRSNTASSGARRNGVNAAKSPKKAYTSTTRTCTRKG